MVAVLTFFFFNDAATTEIYTLSLHDALPIWNETGYIEPAAGTALPGQAESTPDHVRRSEEHTSELQSHVNLVCRLLLEKKKTDTLNGKRHVEPYHTLSAQTRPRRPQDTNRLD